jgi:hypothetical protein
MGAHIADTPPPLRRRSVETPAALESVVMRWLAKCPADRSQGAGDLLTALELVSTPSGRAAAIAPGRRRPLLMAGVAALILAGDVLYATGGWEPRSLVAEGALAEREPVLLIDLENRTADFTLGVTVTEAFRVDLTQSPVVTGCRRSRFNRRWSGCAPRPAVRSGLRSVWSWPGARVLRL